MMEVRFSKKDGGKEQEYECLEYLSWADFRLATEALISQIKEHEKENGFKFDSIYGVPRGGLILAVSLSYKLKMPLIMNENEIKETTIIVDDCTNTGKTLQELTKKRAGKTAIIFHKPSSVFKPDFHFRETDKQINYCWEHDDERN